jgi:hypothetical protein
MDKHSGPRIFLIAMLKVGLFGFGTVLFKSFAGVEAFQFQMSWNDGNAAAMAMYLDLVFVPLACIVVLFLCVCGVASLILFALAPASSHQMLKSFYSQKNVLECFTDCPDESARDVCCICLEELTCSVKKSKICGHVFHENCIKKWISIGTSICPICKQQFQRIIVVQ